MPLNFFLYSAKKDSVWRNQNFRVFFLFLMLCYIRKLASLKIFHHEKALLIDITQKQKQKQNKQLKWSSDLNNTEKNPFQR